MGLQREWGSMMMMPLIRLTCCLLLVNAAHAEQCAAWGVGSDGTLQCTAPSAPKSIAAHEHRKFPAGPERGSFELAPLAPVALSGSKVCFMTTEGELLYRVWEPEPEEDMHTGWKWIKGPQLPGGNVAKLVTRAGLPNLDIHSDEPHFGERLLLAVLTNGKLMAQRQHTGRQHTGRPWQRVDSGRPVLDVGSEVRRQGEASSGLFLLHDANMITIGKLYQRTMTWQPWVLLNATLPLPALADDQISTMSAEWIDNTVFLTTTMGVIISMSKTETSHYVWVNRSFNSDVRCTSGLVQISKSFFGVSTEGRLMEWVAPNGPDDGWRFLDHSVPPDVERLSTIHLPLTVTERSMFMLSTEGVLHERHWDEENALWVWISHRSRTSRMWSCIGAAINMKSFFLGSADGASEYFYSHVEYGQWKFEDAAGYERGEYNPSNEQGLILGQGMIDRGMTRRGLDQGQIPEHIDIDLRT